MQHPDNPGLGNKDLILKVLVLFFTVTGSRGVDLACLPAGSWTPDPFGLQGRDLSKAESVSFAYWDSETGDAAANVKNSRWSPDFPVYPLSADRLHRSGACSRRNARVIATKCCLIRALGELDFRLRQFTHWHDHFVPAGRSNYSGRTFVFDFCTLSNTQPGGISFLKANSINRKVREWHRAQMPGDIGRGSDTGMEVRHYRHCCAKLLDVAGCKEARERRLAQLNAGLLFQQHYGNLAPNSDFVGRWRQLDPVKRSCLTPDERFWI